MHYQENTNSTAMVYLCSAVLTYPVCSTQDSLDVFMTTNVYPGAYFFTKNVYLTL